MFSALAAIVPASPALANPSKPDLAVNVTTDATTLATTGSNIDIDISVHNAGTRTADDVGMVITIPSSAGLMTERIYSAEWQCDVSTTPTWTCTHGSLAAGADAESITFSLHIPGGTDGETATIGAAIATSSPELSTTNNTDQVALRYAAADLTVSIEAVPGEVIVGSKVTLRITVQNVGAGSSTAPYVDIPLPAAVQPLSYSREGWDCNASRDTVTNIFHWGCGHQGPLTPGQIAAPLALFNTVQSGTAGQTLTFTATVRPVDQEPSTDNNTAAASVSIVEPGTIRGVVWGDYDRDGQRDSTEQGDGSRVYRLVFVPQAPAEGDPTEITGTVNPDGTYSMALKPGPYVVQVWLWAEYYDFTEPDTGDDITDSDIVNVDRSVYYNVGNSVVIDLVAGNEATVDAGVVDLPAS